MNPLSWHLPSACLVVRRQYAVRRDCGFCAEHIEMLRRIEIDGMKSTLAISTMFADTFAGIVEDLESLDARSGRSAAPESR